MSAALTTGLFTRTPSEVALLRERAGIHAVLDAIGEADATDATNAAAQACHVAALRRCTDACVSDADLTALRVLAQHAALHRGRVVSTPLRAKLARLSAQCPAP